MIRLARTTNNSMPAYTVAVLQDLLNERGLPIKDTTIAVLGVSYKRNVDDPRESPFFELRKLLRDKGARLQVFDSWVSAENTAATLAECLAGARAIVIVTEHSDMIEELQQTDLGALDIEVIVDGRNCLDGEAIRSQDILYSGIGRRR